MIEDFTLISGHKFETGTVYDAPDPTDIIWENRHFTKTELYCRGAMVAAVCVGLLFASAFILFSIAKGQMNFSATFPPVDCNNIAK